MTFAAPLTTAPAAGTTYNFNQQPITLTITNVVRTGSETVTYSVEVARDYGLYQQGVQPVRGSPRTRRAPPAWRWPQRSPSAASTYYWRWKAVVNGIAGEPSGAQTFFLKPNIVLNAPQDFLAPASGATINVPRVRRSPLWTRRSRATRASISYEFQVSAGVELLVARRVGSRWPQQAGQTSWTPGADLPVGTIFWRARARDLSNSVDSPFPSSSSFERKAGLDLLAGDLPARAEHRELAGDAHDHERDVRP